MSSGEQVRLYVRRLIFDGVLKQGQRVPQDAIAQALGVSRIPVREALIALEREGWTTIIPHRGAFVNALDEPSVRDHYELYGLFYGFGVRRAVERAMRVGAVVACLEHEALHHVRHHVALEPIVVRTLAEGRLGRNGAREIFVRNTLEAIPDVAFERFTGFDLMSRDTDIHLLFSILGEGGAFALPPRRASTGRVGPP